MVDNSWTFYDDLPKKQFKITVHHPKIFKPILPLELDNKTILCASVMSHFKRFQELVSKKSTNDDQNRTEDMGSNDVTLSGNVDDNIADDYVLEKEYENAVVDNITAVRAQGYHEEYFTTYSINKNGTLESVTEW